MGILDEAIREHLELKRQHGADASEIDRLEREALGPVRRAPHDAPDVLIDEEGPLEGAYLPEEEVPYGLEEEPDWGEGVGEPAPFERAVEPPVGAPPAGEWDDPGPATELMPTSDLEPEAPARSYEPPRHHEIAEEWEAHERQGLAAETGGLEPDEPAPTPPVPGPTSSDVASPPAAADRAGPVFGGERQRPAEAERYDLEQETVEHDVEAEELGRPPHSVEDEDVLEETPDFLQDTPDHDRLWFEQRPPRDFDFDG